MVVWAVSVCCLNGVAGLPVWSGGVALMDLSAGAKQLCDGGRLAAVVVRQSVCVAWMGVWRGCLDGCVMGLPELLMGLVNLRA